MFQTLLTCLVLCAQDDAPPAVTGMYHVSFDGASAGFVRGFEGGDPRADVVVAGARLGAFEKKSLGAVRFTPIQLLVTYRSGQPFFDWMAALFAGTAAEKTVIITTLSPTGQPVKALKAYHCVLTRISIATLDTGSELPFHFVLTLTPQSTETVPAVATPAPPVTLTDTTSRFFSSDFKLQIDGLDASMVNRIGGVTISSSGGAVVFSNLAITLAESTAAGWRAWLEDFAVKGNNGDDKEKNGTLQLLGPAGQGVKMTLRLRNLGILSLAKSRDPLDQKLVAVRAELYCERMEIVPEAGALTLVTGITATPAPADQGTADPADFPRPDGLVRKMYATQKVRTGTSESAVYATKTALQELAAQYDKLTKAAGWEQVSRTEAGGALIVSWKKAARVAQVAMVPGKDGVDVTVAITEKR